MPNPTSAYSRFLPQQQYPTGLPPTSPALSYPTASASHVSVTPPPTALHPYTYFPNSTQVTAAGFVRTLPPTTSTYTPHYQNPLPYTPGASSLSFLPSQSTPAPAPAPAPPPPNPLDSSDPNELNDVLGSAGVDVKAEQEALNRARDFYQGPSTTALARADRSRKQAFIDSHILAPTIRSIASNHNITKVSEEAINYAALALRERLLGIINSSIQARNHRLSSTVARPPGMYSDSTPMWSHAVKRDVRKQLSAIEKVEREEEARIRRERHERLENPGGSTVGGTSATAVDSSAEAADASKKRKRAKEMGPGVTAKTMSEEVKKKLVDDAASRAVGGGTKKYAWMNATPVPGAGAAASPTVPKPTPAPGATTTAATATTPVATTNGASSAYGRPTALSGAGGGWMRATPHALRRGADDDEAIRTLTLVDVEFAIDRDKGHGGGRGAARGW